jgi:dTDP-4-dehydrorhamnose 3,5-epimerase
MSLSGVKIWTPTIRPDHRGFFTEVWKSGNGETKFGQIEQISMSRSNMGVLRGLHLQHTEPMGKAMTVVSGRAYLAAVNCNPESINFGERVELEIDAEEPQVFYADAGYARGFLALEPNTVVLYACTGRYSNAGEMAIHPLSADVDWPEMDYIISDKDLNAPTLKDYWLKDWNRDKIDWANVR